MLVVQNASDLKWRGKMFLILVKFEGKKNEEGGRGYDWQYK